MDLTVPNCSRCAKRFHSAGGRGNCPYPDWFQEQETEKGDHDCPSYQLGNRMRAPERRGDPQEDSLF